MSNAQPTLFVVDDDPSVRKSLTLLAESAGWQPETFESGRQFLSRPPTAGPGCLLLDVHLPDLNGLDVQQRLAISTGHADHLHHRLRRHADDGPRDEGRRLRVPDQALGRRRAVVRDCAMRSIEAARRWREPQNCRRLRDCYTSLSRREQEVMGLVVRGRLNKQVGGDLGISEITVKAHRGKMMRKMKARTLPALVLMAVRLCLAPLEGDRHESRSCT